MKKLAITLVFVVSILLTGQDMAAQKIKTAAPVSIIFDTDMGPDYDDVGAIAILHALADKGECRILATAASNKYKYTGPVLSVLNHYFNRPEVPIGVVRGKAVETGARQKWDSLLVADYPHELHNNDKAMDATQLYRRILAAEPDGSVTIVTVGFFTNMANLLESPADQYSPLPGFDLIRKKVKQLVSMAGRFDKDSSSFKEFNVIEDAPAAKKVFDQWPTPILFSGFEIGYKIFTGLPITKNNSIRKSPVKDVFTRSIPMDPGDINGRMSWDETAVLVAIRGYERYFDIRKGKIIGYADGRTGWDYSGRRDAYLLFKMPIETLTQELDMLIASPPKMTKQQKIQ